MATQNTDLKEAKKDAIMSPDMYRSMFLRQFTSQCSQSYDKMMAMGFMYTIQKPLRKIYPNDDDYYAALDRHTEFFNITPHVLPFVAGLTVSMEEQAAADKNFDTSSINAMKVGLMGPLSGIGDSFYWGTFRVVAAGIAISLAAQGNVLGPIIFLLLFNVPQYFLRVWGIHKGYEIGVSLLETAEQSGIMDKVIKAAGIIGMMVVGSMTCGMFWATLAVEFGSGDEVTTLQSVLDGIMPGMLGLAFMGLYYFLLKKKVSPMILILGTMVLGVVGVYFGILA